MKRFDVKRLGRLVTEIVVLLAIYFAGCQIASGLQLPIPGGVVGMALLLPHDAAVTWGAFWYNQLFVVLGNLVGGGLFVGGLYWMVSPYRVTEATVAPVSQSSASVVAISWRSSG